MTNDVLYIKLAVNVCRCMQKLMTVTLFLISKNWNEAMFYNIEQ